jgi:hypothetical protein
MAEFVDPALHEAFGLLWHSPHLVLEELPLAVAPAPGGARVMLADETDAAWPDLPPGPHDTATLTMGPGDLRFTAGGMVRFRITNGERITWQRLDPGAGPREIRTYLLGSAIAALLIQRGVLVLHGNALAREGKAIVCLGHSGAGKSTLAYALMRQGWQLLADDLVAITPDGHVLPGIPRIKLWQDAAEAFGLDPASLCPIHRGMSKYALIGEAIERAPQPMRLEAVYLIQASSGEEGLNPGAIAAIASEKEAAQRLRSQAFMPRFVRGMGKEGHSFLATAHLQRTVPVATLPIPRGIDHLQIWLEERDLLREAAISRRNQGHVGEP